MITRRKGNGQTICKGCKDKGKFGLNWDSFLYNFNEEAYCFDCLMEKLEEYQQRIDKAIGYIVDCTQCDLDDNTLEDCKKDILINILRGISNE